jgi:GntR family transcriptional regulator, transcriptional repressor for pyruvate dehydrogenase complex
MLSDHLMSDNMPAQQSVLLARIERTPLFGTVMERLRGLIDSGAYAPGTKLPSERELCELLVVGRSTAREALRALEALGYVRLEHGRGAFVVDRSAGSSSEDWQLERVAEARLAVEMFAASVAALRRTDSDLALMRAHLNAFEDAIRRDDLAALVHADVAFHAAIAMAANPVLAASLESMEVLGIQSRYKSLEHKIRRASVLKRHEAIFAAINARDSAQATQAMRQHLSDFIEQVGLHILVWNPGSNTVEHIGLSPSHANAEEEQLEGWA